MGSELAFIKLSRDAFASLSWKVTMAQLKTHIVFYIPSKWPQEQEFTLLSIALIVLGFIFGGINCLDAPLSINIDLSFNLTSLLLDEETEELSVMLHL